jgi:hypothetical protein
VWGSSLKTDASRITLEEAYPPTLTAIYRRRINISGGLQSYEALGSCWVRMLSLQK